MQRQFDIYKYLKLKVKMIYIYAVKKLRYISFIFRFFCGYKEYIYIYI